MAREPGWWIDVEPKLPLEENTVEVEGLPIYYRTCGSGPPLLLLHAPTLVGQHWYPFVDELGSHYGLIIPDMPGNGRSPTLPQEGISFSANARVMLRFLDALGVHKVRGIGFSGGAGIVIHMASQQPERMEAMVPISSAHRLPPDEIYRKAFGNWSWETRSREQQLQLLARHPGGIPQVQAIFAAIRRQVDSGGEGYTLSPSQLGAMKARTLLVFGDRDGVLPVEFAADVYRAIPNSMLWIVPGEGHGPPWSSERVQSEFPKVVHAFFQGDLVD
jgi:pimeloyl-ACP methyl ester carboxylesterase